MTENLNHDPIIDYAGSLLLRIVETGEHGVNGGVEPHPGAFPFLLKENLIKYRTTKPAMFVATDHGVEAAKMLSDALASSKDKAD